MASAKKELNHAECVERDLTEWKRIFSLESKIYGYRINRYKGTQKLIYIPDEIENEKVARIQEDCFPKDASVICCKRIFDKLSDSIRINSAVSYLKMPEKYPDAFGKVQKNFIIVEKKAVISALIVADETPAMERFIALLGKKIDLDMLDSLIQSAENSINLKPWLLQYKANRFSPDRIVKIETDQMEKEFGLKKMTLSDWSKNFSFKDEKNKGLCITGYNGTETVIQIPGMIGNKRVTGIGAGAFSPEKPRNSSDQIAILNAITSIELPDSISQIGDKAFYNCKELKTVVFPEKMPTLGLNAFGGCRKLADENGFVHFSGVLFSYFGTEAEPILPAGITRIDDYVFEGNRNIKTVHIADGISVSGRGLFKGCFTLKEVKLPSDLSAIAEEMFCRCEKLSNVTIPESVVAIGKRAFYECSSLPQMIIPDSVACVGEEAFHWSVRLKLVTSEQIENRPESFRIKDGILKKYRGIRGNVEIPPGITEIGDRAFDRCEYLTSISIPNSVESIGLKAFIYCGNLKTVWISEGVKRIESWAFWDCKHLEELHLPESVKTIGHSAIEIYSRLKIYAPSGSYAEQYAKENKIPFVAE